MGTFQTDIVMNLMSKCRNEPVNLPKTNMEHTPTWPPGGTQMPGKVLMCSARRVSKSLWSLDSRSTATPTSTPRTIISGGRPALSSSSRCCMGQNGGCWWNTAVQFRFCCSEYILANIRLVLASLSVFLIQN